MARFADRIRELEDRIGRGTLTGRVEVNQRYAQYQHEGLDLRHPRGGQAKYLEQPLYDGHRGYCDDLADAVLHGDLVDAMTDVVEDLAERVTKTAPVDLNNLRRSASPSVHDGTRQAYHRPPEQRRLTDAELAQRGRGIPGV